MSLPLTGLVIVAGLVAAKLLYNLYLHPLAKYPGPKLYAATPIPISLAQLQGQLHIITKAAHDHHGPVVRLSPNELSFISAPAWQDIYARRQGKPALLRDRTFFNDMLVDSQTMIMANDSDHGCIRRSLNLAFSPRALLDQEPILQKNVDLLMEKLQGHAEQGLSLDLRALYNYTTFDLIGDLAFVETFGCLATSRFREWVQMVLDYFFAATLLHAVHRFYPLNKLLAILLPSSLMEKQKHSKMAIEKVHKRTDPQNSADRPDFIHHLMEAVDSGDITSSELDNQASILILAGSEATSITLTYTTYFLTQHPEVLEKLRAELQGNFKSETDIDLLSVNRLQYLQAVLQESLRCRPPITNGLPRQTPKDGAIVNGNLMPHGTVVNINHWATYQSASNFTQPGQFIPERWMGGSRFNKDNKDAFQPFSVGPRSCIGKKFAYDSMKLILSRLVWRFNLKLEETPKGKMELDCQSPGVFFLPSTTIKRCVGAGAHEAAHVTLIHHLIRKLVFIGSADVDLEGIGAKTTSSTSRIKEVDLAYCPLEIPQGRSEKWPTFALESGYTNSKDVLENNAKWWISASGSDNDGTIGEQLVTVSEDQGGNAHVNSAPLAIPSYDLLLRDPTGNETDIEFDYDGMRRLGKAIWDEQF